LRDGIRQRGTHERKKGNAKEPHGFMRRILDEEINDGIKLKSEDKVLL
jgi:hypothetical protein